MWKLQTFDNSDVNYDLLSPELKFYKDRIE